MDKPIVFISYSHDSDHHREKVLALSERLRDDGIETRLDQYVNGTPTEGWSRWMLNQLDEADFVLVICTETYYKRFRGWDESAKGVDWEGALITQDIYNNKSRTVKYVPVLFSDDHQQFIPEPIGSVTRYVLTSDSNYQALYDFLLGQAGVEPRAIGEPKLKPRRKATPLSFDDQPTQSASAQREQELAYLDNLKAEHLRKLDLYTPISGGSQQQRRVRMHIVCDLESFNREQPVRSFVDAVEELHRIRHSSGNSKRAVLLGKPGSGKTTILWKLADDLVAAARKDPAAPIPLLIRLGFWDQSDQSLFEFVAEQLEEVGGLGDYLGLLLAQKRAALLLDGLNELPVAERRSKYAQVRQFIEAHPKLLAVVSCRKDDYAPNYDFDLGCDRITILPLDAIRIRQFALKYLPEQGEAFFWDLAGKDTRGYYDDFIATVGAPDEDRFWLEPQPPPDLKWTYDGDTENEYSYWPQWIEHRDKTASLMMLACNPYMLSMLLYIYQKQGELPANRGDLFQWFVEVLLEREGILADEQNPLVAGLAQVAYAMQSQRAPGNEDNENSEAEEGNALTVLPQTEVRKILDEQSLKLAVSASLLSPGEQVRFTHQLLQEYFAACYLKSQMTTARSDASAFWPPDRWWQRTNWEEVAIQLAGLYPKDCSEVVEWIASANPKVAAQCATRSGAAPLPAATLERLREQWRPRLEGPTSDTELKARVDIGWAMGLLDLDNRPGVGVVDGLPDIAWVEISDGKFKYGDKSGYAAKPRKLTLPDFYISRFPVTQAQFKTFLDDPEGYGNRQRWFEGLTEDEDDRRIEEPYFKFANHPRDNVTWYQAMAFCRWLSWRKGTTHDLDKVTEWAVRLPTEFEWEKAARGTDGRVYPYEGDYDPAKANTGNTGIGQTSAVGIFPDGASPYGVEEMSGNVWEWCLSSHDNPADKAEDEDLRTDEARLLRGGSWIGDLDFARAVYRSGLHPGGRVLIAGFRLLLVRPPS